MIPVFVEEKLNCGGEICRQFVENKTAHEGTNKNTTSDRKKIINLSCYLQNPARVFKLSKIRAGQVFSLLLYIF